MTDLEWDQYVEREAKTVFVPQCELYAMCTITAADAIEPPSSLREAPVPNKLKRYTKKVSRELYATEYRKYKGQTFAYRMYGKERVRVYTKELYENDVKEIAKFTNKGYVEVEGE